MIGPSATFRTPSHVLCHRVTVLPCLHHGKSFVSAKRQLSVETKPTRMPRYYTCYFLVGGFLPLTLKDQEQTQRSQYFSLQFHFIPLLSAPFHLLQNPFSYWQFNHVRLEQQQPRFDQRSLDFTTHKWQASYWVWGWEAGCFLSIYIPLARKKNCHPIYPDSPRSIPILFLNDTEAEIG